MKGNKNLKKEREVNDRENHKNTATQTTANVLLVQVFYSHESSRKKKGTKIPQNHCSQKRDFKKN